MYTDLSLAMHRLLGGTIGLTGNIIGADLGESAITENWASRIEDESLSPKSPAIFRLTSGARLRSIPPGMRLTEGGIRVVTERV
jgi:hypothetical protein